MKNTTKDQKSLYQKTRYGENKYFQNQLLVNKILLQERRSPTEMKQYYKHITYVKDNYKITC